jgi:hypothetical protein
LLEVVASLSGTRGWKRHSLTLPVDAGAREEVPALVPD